MQPGEYEKVLEEYDIIVFSDVEAKNFQLHPQFFNRHLFGTKVLTFPDRVRLTVEAVRNGTYMMFLGGWLSFNGEMGKGGWGRTQLREVLPCTCLDVEDLRENTEGFTAKATVPDHPLLTGVDLTSMPPVLGFNRVKPREGCEVIAEWSGEGDPTLCAGQFGKGTKAGIQAKHEKRIRLILGRLHASTSPRDMDLPGLRLHPLKGKTKGSVGGLGQRELENHVRIRWCGCGRC